MGARLNGILAARQAFARLPESWRDRINEVNTASAQSIVRDASARARRRTGALRLSIDYSVDTRRGTAKVGVAKGPVFYGHFVEYGTVTLPARPFMRPAVEIERSHSEGRYRDAARRMERDVSAIGARNL